MAELEKVAFGELALTPAQYASYTIREIDALYEGWKRRHTILEDLFIIYGALPAYRSNFLKRPPKYEDLTRHRTEQGAEIDQQLLEFWRRQL